MEFVNVSLPNQEIQLKFLSKKTGNCKDSVLTLFGGIGQKDFKIDGEQLKESTGAGFQRNSQANIET